MKSTLKIIYTFFTAFTLSISSIASDNKTSWPTKPIDFINPFPAGGPTDEVSRYFAKKLSDALGQPVVVQNVPGAGGTIGTQRLAAAPKDGYTIGLAHTGTLSISPLLYSKPGYDPLKDVTPIARLMEYDNILIVNSKSRFQSLQELIDAAKKDPGSITYGSAGNGSSNHLSAALMANMAKVEMTHIPYKGSAPALQDLLGGNTTFMFTSLSGAVQQIQAGQLRALATTGRNREPALPNTPTIGETLPSYSVVGWTAIVGPAGMPEEIVERLTKIIENTLNDPESQKHWATRGQVAAYGNPSKLKSLIKSDLDLFAPVIKAAGAKID